jgi:hypothetical protein
MGAIVVDTARGTLELDPDRAVRIQSLARVVKDPKTKCTDFKGGNCLALNITDSGQDDVVGGLACDKPFAGTATKATRTYGKMSQRWSGPFEVGAVVDKHRCGLDGDGDAINPLHWSTNTLFFKTPKWDAPILFEEQFDDGKMTKPLPVVRSYPFRTYCHVEWDGLLRHDIPCGNFDGMWRIWAETPITDPTDDEPPGVPTGEEGRPPGSKIPGGEGVPTEGGRRVPERPPKYPDTPTKSKKDFPTIPNMVIGTGGPVV